MDVGRFGLWKQLYHYKTKEPCSEGVQKIRLGTMVGLLFWITMIPMATKNIRTKLPCFSHRCETTRLNGNINEIILAICPYD